MTLQNIYRGVFEPNLLAELENCPVVDLPTGTIMRQPENKRVRLTPLVLQGAIKVSRIDETGKEITLYRIESGETCFLTVTASLANNFGNIDGLRAIVEAPTKMISITDEQIRIWHEKYKTWRTFVAQMYNSRLVQFFSLVDALAFKSVETRMIEKLKSLSELNNPITVTHSDLASQLGTAREVVSRLLKRLEQDGKVKLGNKKIEVIGLNI
jgi:CRP/FNR family transcriptional regulator, anaerobic regulatory protein